MIDNLKNIFLNVVAAFIYAGIVWWWNHRKEQPSEVRRPQTQPEPQQLVPTEDCRAVNRQKIEWAVFGFMFYLVTFMVLYFSITMPALFKAMFSKEPVLLSQARVVGSYLPPVPVGKEMLQLAFLIVAAAVYLPLLKLASFLFSLFQPIVDAVVQVTARRKVAFTMLVYLVLCIPVAATSVWLFTEKSYADALATVLAVIAVVFIFGQAQGRR